MLPSVLLVSFLAAICLASPTSRYVRHVQHEKRAQLPDGWRRHGQLQRNFKLPMRIALTQSNLDKAYEHLMSVSHPESKDYGRHWNAKDVAETFAPRQETVDAVKAWLIDSGISEDRISQSQSLGWLRFDASVSEAESLLKTKYHIHKHVSGKPHVACDSYSVPEHLRHHIDFVTPTVHFDTKVGQATTGEETDSKAAVGVPVRVNAGLQITQPTNGFLPKKGAEVNIDDLLDELEDCNDHITPNCLRALYKFPPGFTSNPQNSIGVVAYTPQSYLQSDLDLFFANFSQRQRQTTPTFTPIDGGVLQTTNKGFAFLGESSLDLQYSMSLSNPQNVTLYQVGDLIQGASFNDFLDALDESYCTYQGGDDPIQDGIYPDPAPGGYKGPKACGGFAATKVISTSYGYNEADLTPFYEQRQCNEYMKLGLQGISFFFSSGDFGVAGNNGRCISNATAGGGGNNGTNTTTIFNDGRSGKFNPAFPSTCPYITSVGATQIQPGASVFDPEVAAATVIRSGGGFSNVFPTPEYQSQAIKTYLSSTAINYTSSQYNNSGLTRGYPDISANGVNYLVAVNGIFTKVFGTSASTPTVASIFTLINEARLSIGKPSVGFVNPVLYAFPGLLNDVVEGANSGCGTAGFRTAKGWDPVTGLGTPNFPRLLGRFLGLP